MHGLVRCFSQGDCLGCLDMNPADLTTQVEEVRQDDHHGDAKVKVPIGAQNDVTHSES
jgi:hypothetical protein